MARSSPEKLAAALRANLKRRKGPASPKGEEDGHAARRAPAMAGPLEQPTQGIAKPATKPSKTPSKGGE